MHNSLIINTTSYISFNVHNQAVIHSLNVRRINYGAKFNFIGIKKTEGVPKFFFLKGRQIKIFKLLLLLLLLLLYIIEVRVVLGPPWP